MDPAYFDSFQTFCARTLDQTGWEIYCEPVRVNAETCANWVENGIRPIYNKMKWTWVKTGEHYGEAGQIFLLLLVAGIAKNVFFRKKKDAKEVCPCRRTRRLRHP